MSLLRRHQPNYTLRDIMIDIYEGDHIESDLKSIKSNPLYEVGDEDLILAMLEEIAGSEDACWTLTEWSAESSNPYFNAKAIVWMQRAGKNVYRLRPLTRRLKKYRILYAYNGRVDEIYLLAVVVKKPESAPSNLSDEGCKYYDYETEHVITKRVFYEYAQLGLPSSH